MSDKPPDLNAGQSAWLDYHFPAHEGEAMSDDTREATCAEPSSWNPRYLCGNRLPCPNPNHGTGPEQVIPRPDAALIAKLREWIETRPREHVLGLSSWLDEHEKGTER